MKTIPEMSKIELTAFVQSHLEENGIHAVLSGGTAVSYYTGDQYTSYDIDLVNQFSINRKKIQHIMEILGFKETGRYFTYPQTQFFIEFPPGPVTVGAEPVQRVESIELGTGVLRIISSTDSVKDRLAAYYHWGDEQCLYQAVLIRQTVVVDLDEVCRWSTKEGKEKEYQVFLSYSI